MTSDRTDSSVQEHASLSRRQALLSTLGATAIRRMAGCVTRHGREHRRDLHA